jgi:ribose transport system substrate-binding protein
LLTACGQSLPRQKLVTFSQVNNAEPYRAAQKALMQELFAKTADVRLVVADAEQDNSKQIAQIETFILQKPAVLTVAPNERAALTAVMGQAMRAGIPVICLERDILQPNYTTYIRTDNLAIGRMVGLFIVDQLTKKYGAPKGNVVVLRGLLGVEAQIDRDGGARDILNRYPQIHIVADPVADWVQAKAKDRMNEVLRVQPQIDVVFGHNDPMAVGAYLAAKESNRDREMIFIGVDGLGGRRAASEKYWTGFLPQLSCIHSASTMRSPLRSAFCVTRRLSRSGNTIWLPLWSPQKTRLRCIRSLRLSVRADVRQALHTAGC